MTMASYSSSSSSLFKKPSSSEAKRLTKRQENVFKKANELSILCGVEVCVIYYGSNGELKTWPEDREKVKDMARRYSELSEAKREVKQYDLDLFLESIKKDNDSKNKKKKKKRAKLGSSYKYPDWHPRFDKYSVEQLEVLIQSLERSQTMMQHRLRAVVESQRQRNMHYTNMAGQEQIMVPERSNQASMNLFNHGNSTLPQSQASISASNQAYSLAPLPNSLTIHQDPNMEMYSRLLASQGAGMNEVFNTSMLPYNGFNTNCLNGFSNQFYQNCFEVEDPYGVQGAGINNNMKVEDYSGLLWTQGTGMNGLQNGYNSNNNNTNGYPHQLVQTPPVYQYMDRSTQSVRPLYEI
uniref:MADS-box domain-containing protein n=2 Tax=Brassica oleracea var. oleracea TaxID=109376 RepID=A0A0D3BC09_BRAOL